MQFWERPERTYGLAAYIALPIIIRLRLLTLFFCFCSIMKQQQKLLCKFIFHKKENGSWI